LSNFDIGLWSFVVVLALIFIRIPIGLSMLVVGIGGNVLVMGHTRMISGQLKNLTYGEFSNYSLSILPLFLLMGQFATLGGMSTALFKAAEAFLGHRKGGVAMASVGACAGFGAICGSSLATAATMGQVALPELRRYGYSGALSTGTLAAGGTLGILIPPSVILVIYAILAEQNVAKLFVAAVIPGVLAMLGYIAAIAIYVRVFPNSGGVRPRVPYRERFAALRAVWPVLAVFIVVIGGIYQGLFTPTQGAAVGAFGTGLIAWMNGGLTWRSLMGAFKGTAMTTGMIYLIVLGAKIYNNFLALTRVPQDVASYIGAQGFDPWWVLVIVLVAYLVFGCIMDSLSMILLTVPIVFPIMIGLDFGMSVEEFGLWFGILVLIVVEVGLITPPVGMNLFVINTLSRDIPISETFKGVFPFVITDLLRVVVLVIFPSITLYAVRTLY